MPPRIDDMLFPQPLQADFTHPDGDVVVAYALCRTCEHAIIDRDVAMTESDCQPPHWDKTASPRLKLIHVRVLGHLLSQSGLLSDMAVSSVARDILRCKDEGAGEASVDKLDDLGRLYKDSLLRPFHKFKGVTSRSRPSDAEHESAQFPLTKEELSQMAFATPRSHEESRFQAMVREECRCIVTRILDKPYARTLLANAPVDKPLKAVRLEYCHIFADSVDTVVDSHEHKTRNRWTLLRSLGYHHLVDRFATPEGIHALDNVMMVMHMVQDNFHTLDLWFEPVQDIPNHYRLYSVFALPDDLEPGHEVTFHSPDPRLPLPNRDYFAIHAACARVSQLSGASRLFAAIQWDMEADPDPAVEETDFARALHAHLENLQFAPRCRGPCD